MRFFIARVIVGLISVLTIGGGFARAESPLDLCVRESIPAVGSGTKNPDEYVAIRTFAKRILRRGWDVRLKKVRPDIAPSQVLSELEKVITVILRRRVAELSDQFVGATAAFTEQPQPTRQDSQYSIKGILKVPSGEYKGTHSFRAVVYIPSDRCFLQSIRITIEVLGSDLFTLKGWLETQDEVSALLELYKLN